MTPEARARKLKKEADRVLKMINFRKHSARVGKFIPTGSYFLDLMMYPDIDLYLLHATPEGLFRLGIKLMKYKWVTEISFQKGSKMNRRELARGFYLRPLINYGNWGRQWKIDIWTLPGKMIDKKMTELQDLKARMTQAQKKTILDYKYRILTDQGRTPMFSGIFIYRAVIDRGMTRFSDITKYLKKNGIKM